MRILRLTLAIALLLAPRTMLHADAAPKKPNVILFLTDDESWLERSAYGWSKIPTPNFDRLAREGILFTHAYASAPSCAPSRASLLTGRNFWELEQGAFINAWLPKKFTVLPEVMEANGYFSGFTGKGWGPGLLPPSGRTRNPAGNEFNNVKYEYQEDDISKIDYTGNFEKFLKERPAGKPFFLWMGTHEPHSPWAKDNYKKLKEKYGISLDAIGVPSFLPDTVGVRRNRADMLYSLCHTDSDLGKLLKILEDRGELNNTLLIVTSDNGTQVPRAKANVYDWGVHEPMAIMWPARIKPGRRVDDFINFADIAPTILQAAGLPAPPEMSGRSFLDVLLSSASGKVDPTRSWTAAGLEWHGELEPVNLAGRMIVDERYQYIVNYSSSPRGVLDPKYRLPDERYSASTNVLDAWELLTRHPDRPELKRFFPLLVNPRPHEELYDLQTDPWELNNLADSPEYAAIKARLKVQLEAYQRKTKDPRITGDMEIFNQTRKFVENRKLHGYKDVSPQANKTPASNKENNTEAPSQK